MFALQKLNHVAWRCRDAEETRHFYQDILGMKLAYVVEAEEVPSTGEATPYLHIFFEMADGSYIAFFDVGDGKGATLSDDMPDWLHHFAFEVETIEEVLAAKARLEAAGVEVLGVVDHGLIQSIYFFDPNGVRMEITMRTEAGKQPIDREAGRHAIAQWCARKQPEQRQSA